MWVVNLKGSDIADVVLKVASKMDQISPVGKKYSEAIRQVERWNVETELSKHKQAAMYLVLKVCIC